MVLERYRECCRRWRFWVAQAGTASSIAHDLEAFHAQTCEKARSEGARGQGELQTIRCMDELTSQIEIDLLVDLSQRQRSIYKALRQRVSISDLLAQAGNITDSSGAKNLMNLVMQFRKVCNHPDLFERADVVSPYVFGNFSHSGNLARQEHLYCPESLTNPIKVELPRILWTDGGKLDVPSEKSLAGSDTKVLGSLMNIWSTSWISERSKQKKDDTWGFLKFMGDGPGDAHRKAKSHPLVSLLDGSLVREHRKECSEYERSATPHCLAVHS